MSKLTLYFRAAEDDALWPKYPDHSLPNMTNAYDNMYLGLKPEGSVKEYTALASVHTRTAGNRKTEGSADGRPEAAGQLGSHKEQEDKDSDRDSGHDNPVSNITKYFKIIYLNCHD